MAGLATFKGEEVGTSFYNGTRSYKKCIVSIKDNRIKFITKVYNIKLVMNYELQIDVTCQQGKDGIAIFDM